MTKKFNMNKKRKEVDNWGFLLEKTSIYREKNLKTPKCQKNMKKDLEKTRKSFSSSDE